MTTVIVRSKINHLINVTRKMLRIIVPILITYTVDSRYLDLAYLE